MILKGDAKPDYITIVLELFKVNNMFVGYSAKRRKQIAEVVYWAGGDKEKLSSLKVKEQKEILEKWQ